MINEEVFPEEIFIKRMQDLEKLIDFSDPEIKILYDEWFENDCSIVGLSEILVYQNIKEEKKYDKNNYDKDYDKIVLRYGQKSILVRLLELSLKKNFTSLSLIEEEEFQSLFKEIKYQPHSEEIAHV
jgi:hypothetical protein